VQQPAYAPVGPPMHHVPGGVLGGPPPFHPPVDVRPAPLGGRRSPPPVRGYSRSPSPPASGEDDSYGRRHHRIGGGGGAPHRRGSYRDSSPEGDRSRYDSGRYDRYSRERSPDR
jgi:hypothetical protein